MAITDLQVSDTLETSAPSIRYEGNEGPKSPEEQQQMMLAQLEQEYEQYKIQQMEIDPAKVLSFEEWYQSEYQAARQGVAHGGVMRQRYGLGKLIRKLIPNEVAKVAEVAAPFVAPFNPAIAGLMGGLGSYDRTGKLGGALKSGLMNYGMGQGARYLGGAGLQGNPFKTVQQGGSGAFRGGLEGLKGGFSSPYKSGKDIFSRTKEKFFPGGEDVTKNIVEKDLPFDWKNKKAISEGLEKGTSGIMDFINKNSTAILLGSMGIAAATAKPQDMKEAINATRGTKLDIDGIRKEVQEAFEGGEEAWNELKKKYPYIGQFSTKKAEGGRIGYYAGGQSIPSEYTMEDARKTSMQDKMGGITEVMKRADLSRRGDVGQMYMAEGGLMDLGGMEKDYRNDGGFVPIGGKEKADDVPARLSKNEFVFTADAVRAAGGGNIDQGAEVMEKVMKNLEQGGQISEETQGLSGAREMFGVSERLSEVV